MDNPYDEKLRDIWRNGSVFDKAELVNALGIALIANEEILKGVKK